MRRLIALAALAVALAAPAAALAQERPRGDTRVFALIPRPGFPAMAYVAPNGRVYEGTYTNPGGDNVPSRVFEYEADGTLMRSWTIRGQNLSEAHGVQVGTFDARGRLILLDKNPPRVLRLDRVTGEQETIARFPAGAIPNYAAWGPDNALYVTDYEGATIWRVPPGGGDPKRWLQDANLDGGPFGTTGIVLEAGRTSFLISQMSAAGGGAGNPTTGRLLRVPLAAGGAPGPISVLWESTPFDAPDGFAVAKSGVIYVALLAANQIAVIGPDGAERERFGGAGSPVPFDAPSSARFLGTRLMVANQAYITGEPAHHAILDVETREAGLPEYIPPEPAAKKKKKVSKKNKQRKRKRGNRRRSS